jgi:hypothetical protein
MNQQGRPSIPIFDRGGRLIGYQACLHYDEREEYNHIKIEEQLRHAAVAAASGAVAYVKQSQ